MFSEPITAETLRTILSEYEPFADLPQPVLEGLANAMEPVFVPAGELFIQMGQLVDHAYLIEFGRLRAIVPSPEGDMSFELGRGEFIGLFPMLTKKPTKATLYALRDSKVLRVSKQAFFALAGQHPELLVGIARDATQRFKQVLGRQERQRNRPLNFGLLPLVKDEWTRDCEQSLQQALAAVVGPGTSLGSDDLPKIFGHTDPSHLGRELPRHKLMNWTYEAEAKGEFLLLRGDASDTKWNQWCLHQAADRVLVAVRADATSELARLDGMLADRVLAGAPIKIDLLLIHDSDTELPSRTRPWLGLQCLRRHHHVRRGHGADFRRVVRRLTERGVGVVLSGGGARGLAHIGVLQALEEAGIPIDYIGGTSMGAIMAAGYARGWSPTRIMDRVREVFAVPRALIDMTLPIASLLAGRKLDRIMKELFAGIDIEDLWTSYFCISASVSQARMVVHQHGPLWKCVRASISMPGIFPPVQAEGQVLVDGGIMNNVPMDVMRAECRDSGAVIAVNVAGAKEHGMTWREHDQDGMSGWRLLGERINPFAHAEPIPNIFETLTWATTLSSQQYLKQMLALGQADLFLTPPVQDYELLGFEAYRDLCQVGYEYASNRLKEWDQTSQLRST